MGNGSYGWLQKAILNVTEGRVVTTRPPRWQPPSAGVYRINVDTTISIKHGCIDLGYIVRNKVGEVMGVISNKRMALMSSQVVKIWVILLGFWFTMNIGFNFIF